MTTIEEEARLAAQWRPAGELPDTDREVVTLYKSRYTAHRYYAVATYVTTEGRWYSADDGFIRHGVIAWMDIPRCEISPRP